MAKLITQAEYARRRGVSAPTVNHAIKVGRISSVEGKVDPDVADIEWEANRRRSPKITNSPPQIAGAPRGDLMDALADGMPTLEASRRRREYHEANIAAMREQQKAGELVELAQVNLAYTTMAAQLRAALERIPDKLAPRLAVETEAAAIHDLLTAELDQALMDMAASAAQLPTQLMNAAHDN